MQRLRAVRPHRAEDRGGGARGQERRAPPAWRGGAAEIQQHADHQIGAQRRHAAGQQCRGGRGGGIIGRPLPAMQRRQRQSGPGAEQRQGQHRCGAPAFGRGGAHGFEPRARCQDGDGGGQADRAAHRHAGETRIAAQRPSGRAGRGKAKQQAVLVAGEEDQQHGRGKHRQQRRHASGTQPGTQPGAQPGADAGDADRQHEERRQRIQGQAHGAVRQPERQRQDGPAAGQDGRQRQQQGGRA